MTAIGQLGLGTARSLTIQLSCGPIAALRAGPDGAAAVLLVPGYTGSKEDFGPIIDPIADAGFQVTAIDLPGQYESPGPADPAAYTTDSLGACVREIAGGLGPIVHLLGHSFGGLVARSAVIGDPSCFADLVLMGSGPAAIEGLRRLRLDQLAPVFAELGAPAIYAAMQALEIATPGYAAPPAALAEFLEHRFLTSSPAMLHGMADALRAEPDRIAALRASGIGCLVMHGAQDVSWPPAVQAEMARRLGAQYVVIDDAAHSPAIESADRTATALLRFWRSNHPARR
ncbi:MAG: alpha/beta hydrolase [Pseudonocardiales bacterium]|nr:MAG: alpha/beta hydrolase [Pseudonocardiales bacterium]